jgi:hypothetical protein
MMPDQDLPTIVKTINNRDRIRAVAKLELDGTIDGEAVKFEALAIAMMQMNESRYYNPVTKKSYIRKAKPISILTCNLK